ncbi:MAG: PEP-CTERM sorting domain-containing protein [Phycisphaerales bacterium]
MRKLAQPILIISVLLVTAGPLLAQGTATSPSTVHVLASDGNIYVGGPNDLINGPAPYPIDLDITGGPWRKQMKTDPLAGGGAPGKLIETIQNVGTESWYDWHETFISGGIFGNWSAMDSVLINGTPITFDQAISGTTLTIDNFSQPVLPGDVLTLTKSMITTDNVIGPDQVLFTVLEYPTPEPASAALLALGASACLVRKRN